MARKRREQPRCVVAIQTSVGTVGFYCNEWFFPRQVTAMHYGPHFEKEHPLTVTSPDCWEVLELMPRGPEPPKPGFLLGLVLPRCPGGWRKHRAETPSSAYGLVLLSAPSQVWGSKPSKMNLFP